MSTQIKSVGVRELKNNLSFYLREVKNGARLLVCDRDQVIAQLSQVRAEDTAIKGEQRSELDRWVEDKVISPAGSSKKKMLGLSPVSLPSGTSAKLLAEDREDKK